MQGGRPRRPAARLTRGSWRRSAQRGSGPDDPMGRSTPVLRRCGGVRTGQRATGGEKIETAAELTCVGSRPNYGEDAAQIGAKGLRVMPGLGAGLWRGLAGVVARQGGVAATVWRSGAGQSWWRRLLGLGMAARGWMGCRGAAGWFKRGSAGHLGEGAGMEGHGDLGGLCGLAVPWARRGGEETDRWGQAASETRRPGERSTAGADVWVRGAGRRARAEVGGPAC